MLCVLIISAYGLCKFKIHKFKNIFGLFRFSVSFYCDEHIDCCCHTLRVLCSFCTCVLIRELSLPSFFVVFEDFNHYWLVTVWSLVSVCCHCIEVFGIFCWTLWTLSFLKYFQSEWRVTWLYLSLLSWIWLQTFANEPRLLLY